MVASDPHEARSKRILIAGAGAAGRSLAADVTANGEEVVGFLDDSASSGDILGRLTDVAEVCGRLEVDVVYFAIPSASADTLRAFVSAVPRDRVELAIIPRTYRVMSRERVSVNDLTDVDVLDMVGRAPIKHDMMDARQTIQGKRIMVTGAAGSIGSRIVAQLHALEPELVICVDRTEAGIFHLGQSLQGVSNIVLAIGDVQSPERMAQLVQEHQPDMLFHVAAYKHVPLMQENAVEAFNNNVWGTLNVLQQAENSSIKRVVCVSTDKAVHPTNVMGATKRIGELLLQEFARTSTTTHFNAVRFGNVLESEGSVMQTFRRQLLRGQNLTVTHPDITRYFMTVDEASQLVIQTASRGTQGDLFVLDMGEPIRLYDLAQSLIAAVNPTIGIDIIGLRPGEKMYEELSYEASSVDSTAHPKIFIFREDAERSSQETLAWVRKMLKKTRTYSIADSELVNEMRAFGFTALQ